MTSEVEMSFERTQTTSQNEGFGSEKCITTPRLADFTCLSACLEMAGMDS